MSDKGWSRTFADPIPLPDGGELHTLRDAGQYVTALSKAEHDKPHWQTAAGELVIAAERGGIMMLAEIAMRQALSRRRPKLAAAPRKRQSGNTGSFVDLLLAHALRLRLDFNHAAWIARLASEHRKVGGYLDHEP